MRWLTISCVCISSVWLRGCEPEDLLPTTIEIECSTSGECTGTGTWELFQSMNGGQLNSLIDGNMMTINTGGSNVGIPTSGSMIVTARNGSGQVLGQQIVNWTKSGDAIVASTPNQVDNWLQSLPSGVNKITADLSSMPVVVHAGSNALMMEALYGSEWAGSAGDVWSIGGCSAGELPPESSCIGEP